MHLFGPDWQIIKAFFLNHNLDWEDTPWIDTGLLSWQETNRAMWQAQKSKNVAPSPARRKRPLCGRCWETLVLTAQNWDETSHLHLLGKQSYLSVNALTGCDRFPQLVRWHVLPCVYWRLGCLRHLRDNDHFLGRLRWNWQWSTPQLFFIAWGQ